MDNLPLALLCWYDIHKRRMPWRDIHNPYATWVSETMLQQTQVSTVISYYERFMSRFPALPDLAAAPLEDVMKLWEGLGYYSRARNLKKGAEQVMRLHGGMLPKDEKALLKISGIGPYTAGAILSIAYDLPYPAVDGNVIRVLSRIDGIREDVTHKEVLSAIRTRAQALCDNGRPGDFNQAVMDLGATICVPGTPNCDLCPVSTFCDAFKNGDAAELPVKTQSRPPKTMQVGVAVITCENRVLVVKRKERLLGGLYVFILDEESSSQDDLSRTLALMSIPCTFKADMGQARHVFTHRVWNMRLYHYEADAAAAIDGAQWATREELIALPFPTAMKAAREMALALLI